MNNKNDYMLLSKSVTTIISNLTTLSGNISDLTKNFSKGFDSEYLKNDSLVKLGNDINAIKTDLSDKVLPELKKKSV